MNEKLPIQVFGRWSYLKKRKNAKLKIIRKLTRPDLNGFPDCGTGILDIFER